MVSGSCREGEWQMTHNSAHKHCKQRHWQMRRGEQKRERNVKRSGLMHALMHWNKSRNFRPNADAGIQNERGYRWNRVERSIHALPHQDIYLALVPPPHLSLSACYSYGSHQQDGFKAIVFLSDRFPWPLTLVWFPGQLAALPAQRSKGVSGEWADQGLQVWTQHYSQGTGLVIRSTLIPLPAAELIVILKSTFFTIEAWPW